MAAPRVHVRGVSTGYENQEVKLIRGHQSERLLQALRRSHTLMPVENVLATSRHMSWPLGRVLSPKSLLLMEPFTSLMLTAMIADQVYSN